MTNMATFDTHINKNQARYRVMDPSSQNGLDKVNGVFGFGSCTYKGKFYYFFGGLGFNKNLKVRLCTSQAVVFDPDTRSYELMTLWHKPERLLTERRYVTTLLVDRQMLCLGGINKHGYGLSDLLSINLETRQWKELTT